jgi:hypothetical protein
VRKNSSAPLEINLTSACRSEIPQRARGHFGASQPPLSYAHNFFLFLSVGTTVFISSGNAAIPSACSGAVFRTLQRFIRFSPGALLFCSWLLSRETWTFTGNYPELEKNFAENHFLKQILK